jgi:hypothetical protein
MTRRASLPTASEFVEPFVGHLPGYRAETERTAPGPPDPEVYSRYLTERWQALLDSQDSRDERLLQGFLERHPSLLPGSHSVDGDSGHSAFPLAIGAGMDSNGGTWPAEPEPVDPGGGTRDDRRRMLRHMRQVWNVLNAVRRTP